MGLLNKIKVTLGGVISDVLPAVKSAKDTFDSKVEAKLNTLDKTVEQADTDISSQTYMSGVSTSADDTLRKLGAVQTEVHNNEPERAEPDIEIDIDDFDDLP